jgi:hypothetical protein
MWAGLAAVSSRLLSGPVLYSLIRSIYGGPSTPALEVGDAAIAVAESETAEDAA